MSWGKNHELDYNLDLRFVPQNENNFFNFLANHWGKILLIALSITAIAGALFVPVFGPLIGLGMLGLPLASAAIGWQVLATLGIALGGALVAELSLVSFTYGVSELVKNCVNSCFPEKHSNEYEQIIESTKIAAQLDNVFTEENSIPANLLPNDDSVKRARIPVPLFSKVEHKNKKDVEMHSSLEEGLFRFDQTPTNNLNLFS